ncbi:MAG: hypothetical protein IJ458_04315 [Clostridia bacterium]|nr:hypothetical protein [Clostridia bacterium]
MKKLSLLFATLLVLVSSIVFCSCNDGYKDLKIECSVEQINLVLDLDSYCKCNGGEELMSSCLSHQIINFELDGAKSWGDISIESNPSGLVTTQHIIDGNNCEVLVSALQPTGEGASLVITHLGSGKSFSVPLNIGRKLQTVESANLDFVVESPQFTEDEIASNVVKRIEIPTKKLLNCQPENYTDTILWRIKGTDLPSGINVVSYDKSNNQTAVFTPNPQDSSKGTTEAVKSVIEIASNYDRNSTITINPVSALKGEATLHNVEIEVCIADLLKSDDIVVSSTTHGNDNDVLEDLVLISNPDEHKPRELNQSRYEYDYYSTALIDFKLSVENDIQGEGIPATILKSLSQVNPKFSELYEINISTDIDALRLETKNFGSIRAIATSTCVGSGYIKVDFVPKACVGDIKEFTINIPCTVGERATSFKATNNGQKIEVEKEEEDDYTFKSTTALNDSNSLGQAFKFDILSTNTLSALKYYTITINKHLLRIKFNYTRLDSQPNDWSDNWKSYYTYNNTSKEYVQVYDNECPNFVSGKYYQIDNTRSDYIKTSNGSDADLTGLEKGNYQIAILKDGREITFTVDGDNFVSERLKIQDTIYMKWLKTTGTKEIGNFGIVIKNVYDQSYNIKNHGFDKTCITYNLSFERQRTVESISYEPIMITTNNGEVSEVPTDAGNDWQFYFQPNMLDNNQTFYGIRIYDVLGLNGTILTADELEVIGLNISIQNVNIGFAKYSNYGEGLKYINNYPFDFDSSNYTGYENVIILGKTGDIQCGDYFIDISQGAEDGKPRTISTIGVKVYKQLQGNDVSVTISAPDFSGERLLYEYQPLNTQPNDWGTTTYYECIGGQYIKVKSSDEFNPNKLYYTKVDIDDLDINNTYILSTSNQYKVNIDISNSDFVNTSGQEVTAVMVNNPTKTSNKSYANYLPSKDADGNDIIRTSSIGSFDVETNTKNYVAITYTIKANTYSYYKLNKGESVEIPKTIYIYVYEPLTSATFDSTMLYKYNYHSIPNSNLKEEYGQQTLNIQLNNNSETILDYVDIKWIASGTGIGDGICDYTVSSNNASAEFTFGNRKTLNGILAGRIIATINQFGVQYPIYCNYEVSEPILSERVVLNTHINTFSSGNGYINLKVGEQITIDATTTSSKGKVSFSGVEYIVCSTSGYQINSIATIDDNGLLKATSAGKAKLIIVAKDQLNASLLTITNYFNTMLYIQNNSSYIMVDIIVSDGSIASPYLIASGSDFEKISNDVDTDGEITKHYALVNDIDLNGKAISFDKFSGTISSFKERENSDNRFSIYGIMLNESNPALFKVLNANDDGLAVLENIDFHIDINYVSTKTNKDIDDDLIDILIGLVGKNSALIKDITITISGKVNANNHVNNYIIGSMVALNIGDGTIDMSKLTKQVGVQGDIYVTNSNASTVVLGGVIGENQGKLIGANIPSSIVSGDDDVNKVEYDVYYDKQGATADIVLQVENVNNLDNSLDNSAIGGVIGKNVGSIDETTKQLNGTMINVYSTGKILGHNSANVLTVNNIGGLIGKNIGVENTNVITTSRSDPNSSHNAVDTITIEKSIKYQVTNSYSNAQVIGNNNVGGAIGYDIDGTYEKVYYEIYQVQQSIKGNDNVGGLIGNANDTTLNYCYANSFAWNYQPSVQVYDIEAINNVGGLIGLGTSSRSSYFEKQKDTDPTLSVVNSVASVSLTGSNNVSGIIGRLECFGAIYTAYFYGVIDANISSNNLDSITKMYAKDGKLIFNIPYNNIYAIVNGEGKIGINTSSYGQILNNDDGYYQGTTISSNTPVNGFNVNSQYNNSKPYVVYKDGTSLVSVIPTVIQINQAFTRSAMYRPNKLGDYVKVDENYVKYDPSIHNINQDRYSLLANLELTGDSSSSLSDYRQHALILYYYPLSDMTGEFAVSDYNYLNIVDMKDIVSSEGIIVLPNTYKRFNLRSSNAGVASVLSNGRLLLNGEGQTTITLMSTLNPSATASFVVIVRSQVLNFKLYSNANLRDEYNITNDTTISVVKNSSKIIYADYSSIIYGEHSREYKYKSATNMLIEFKIDYSGKETILPIDIAKYVALNQDYYIRLDAHGNIIDAKDTTTIVDKYLYRIPYGIPITITVNQYVDGKFEITATPYVVAGYKNGNYSKDILVKLSNFETSFNVVTKKGASAVNVNKNQLDMMPADKESRLNVKVTTDVQVDKLYISREAVGEIYQNPNNGNDLINTLDVSLYYIDNNTTIVKELVYDNDSKEYYFDISGIDIYNMLQTATIVLKLNDQSYYIDVAYRLQLDLYVYNGSNKISTTVFINVKPQAISSVISLNYRMEDKQNDINKIKLDNAYQSKIIRPGETNIIAIDIAPNIAIYDHIKIMDITSEDKILFQQVKLLDDGRFVLLDNMDIWADNGIKLIKHDVNASTLYVVAKLPSKSMANITHTIHIVVYDKAGNELNSSYLNLEAVMYPKIEMTYTYPNGKTVVADTSDGVAPQTAEKTVDLALGVEAGIDIKTDNTDEGSLSNYITVTNGLNDVTSIYGDFVRLEEVYGKYILTFDLSKQSRWDELLGKQINVNFTASKSLNGITETCRATIKFNIRRFVVHGVSMYQTSSQGKVYGNWDEAFNTYFYFDKTDISYYYKGYWNVAYTLEKTNPDNYEGALRTDMEYINNILKAFNTLGSDGVNIFFVNNNVTDISKLSPLTNNGYEDDTISIVNENYRFTIKAKQPLDDNSININDMKFIVQFKFKYEYEFYPVLTTNEVEVLTQQFGFDVTTKTTPFIEYEVINSQQEFENMVEGRYYQIVDSLTFIDYTPINTAIGGFKGNGNTITIKNFNIAQLEIDYISGGMYIGLFGILAENSVIENLQVEYRDVNNRDEIVEVNLNDSLSIQQQHTNDIYFGGIAGQNLGVITNVKVYGAFTLKAQYISAQYIDLGGITAINGSQDSKEVATITGSSVELKMSAMALIGGVSGTNYGKITNTNFKGSIKSNDSNQYVAEITTAGFVVQNLNGAYISLSYVQCGIKVGSYNIHSVGRTAGFVLNNAGTITNCYINQTSLSSQGNIGGFVYQSTGNISNSYAYATLGSSLFYNGFIYVTNTIGTITNCYVITDNDININVSGLTLVMPSELALQSKYYGFIFANGEYGVWSISNNGPQLLNSGFNPNKNEYENICNIYDVETFENFFDLNTNLATNTIEGKTFRLVRDIDFEAEGKYTNPTTFNKILKASFEGNDMVLKNYNIYKTEDVESVGLFSNIGNLGLGVYVRNLILQPSSIKASGSNAVGALAGVIDSANIYNITIDNNNLLILGKNAVGGLVGIAKGSFEIMGITSNVSAFATYAYNQTTQYNLYMGKNVSGNTLLDNLDEVSYAGSFAGIVDGYNMTKLVRDINYYYTVSNINIDNDLVIIGETVGGAFGLVGERTLVKDVNYNLSDETVYQGVYVAGGLVGENRGIIQSSKIYAYTYVEGVKQRVNTTNCFNNSARVNGGIVGFNIGGLIDNCSSDIDVVSNQALATIGGIVGRNIEGSVYNCSVAGSVEGFFVGGIVGTDYKYSTIIKQQNSYGVATLNTLNVYKNIKNGAVYESNCFVNEPSHSAETLYSNNTLETSFINKFIVKRSSYYSFNTSYMENVDNGLVNATAIYGLVLGLSDSTFVSTIGGIGVEVDDGNQNYIYQGKLIITLKRGLDSSEREGYTLIDGSKQQQIKPINKMNIIANNFEYDNLKAIFLYIIAYDKSQYDDWSSTFGYTQEYIVFSKNGLDVWEEQS